MNDSLNVLIVSPEMAPFVKTGGLADIIGSLPGELKKLDHDIRAVLPLYSSIALNRGRFGIEPFQHSMGVWMGNVQEWCSMHRAFTDSGVPVYFIEHNIYFDRTPIYHDSLMNDYLDNPRRFAFLCRAALQLCIDQGFSPHVVHCNDWQTALIPGYLKEWHHSDPILGRAASLLTIHNVAYQGIYPRDHLDYIGLGWHNFAPHIFENYGQLNFLKGGIHFADVVNTVSPTYAKEIAAPYGGNGMAPYLSTKGSNFIGILNGADYGEWSPDHDRFLPAPYSIDNMEGKKSCKRALQERFLLTPDDHVALLGAVGRFVDQKGYDLLAQSIDRILSSMHVQFVILGTGRGDLEHFFRTLPERFPGRAGSYIGFSDELAHLIEAGSDFFLMPSLYEPCGLNQIYSLRYGTLPIVRVTGGLADTVEPYNEGVGSGTGFRFTDMTPTALYHAVGQAVSTYYDRRHHMASLVVNAMSRNFSLEQTARDYVNAYRQAMLVKGGAPSL
jgi:starch synthase